MEYRLALSHEIGDVPIETLCLPKVVNTILKNNGYLRVYNLLGVKLNTINGIGRDRADIISQRLRTFFSFDL